MDLSQLRIGDRAVIESVGGSGALRQHFLDMGVIPGAEVTLMRFAPLGDPMELRIHGYELSLRLEDAANISVILNDKDAQRSALSLSSNCSNCSNTLCAACINSDDGSAAPEDCPMPGSAADAGSSSGGGRAL